MALIFWGEVSAASDVTMTAVVENGSSEFRAAVLDLLEQVAAGIIADDPTVAAAAAAAVDDALASEDIIVGSDPRAMKMGDVLSWRAKDSAGDVVAEANAVTGVFSAPDFSTRRARIAGGVFTESDDGVHRWLDSAGKLVFSVDANTGKTYIGDLDATSNVFGGGGSEAHIARVLVLWECGQSNGAGSALPIGERLDIPHPRIQMAQWTDTVVTGVGIATVPTSTQAVRSQAGLDIATVIARRIVSEQSDTVVVICNAAKGGSAVVRDTENGVWGVDYTGVNRWCLPIAKSALTATLSNVAALWPGVPVDVQMVWHQGESDAGYSYAVYKPALQAVFEDLRAHAGDPSMPIVMGGTVPEDSSPTEEATIMAAQIALQGEMEYVAFTAGIPNGGGSGAPTGDTVHYHRDGMQRLGEHMHHALHRAYVNDAASIPLPPLDVTARVVGGVLSMQWSFPTCRATDFAVEYSTDGGTTWQPITGRPRPLDPVATATGLTGTVLVRVATVNEVGTSAFTTPVTAIGA